MTLKEFLDFISQSNGHFFGFLIVFGMVSTFITKIFLIFSRYYIKPIIKSFESKEIKKEEK